MNGLLREAKRDLGTVQIQPLALLPDGRGPTFGKRWQAQGPTVEAAVLPLGGREVYALGKEAGTDVVRVHLDLKADGESPIGRSSRFLYRGGEWNPISVRPFPQREHRGAIIEAERVT